MRNEHVREKLGVTPTVDKVREAKLEMYTDVTRSCFAKRSMTQAVREVSEEDGPITSEKI